MGGREFLSSYGVNAGDDDMPASRRETASFVTAISTLGATKVEI